jgi:hypothetical protein
MWILPGPKRSIALLKNISRKGPLTPQISPLRSFGAPVEMTKGRAALPTTVVAEQDPFFIALGGSTAHNSSGRKTFPSKVRYRRSLHYAPSELRSR